VISIAGECSAEDLVRLQETVAASAVGAQKPASLWNIVVKRISGSWSEIDRVNRAFKGLGQCPK